MQNKFLQTVLLGACILTSLACSPKVQADEGEGVSVLNTPAPILTTSASGDGDPYWPGV